MKTTRWISLGVLGEAGLKMYSIFMSLSSLFVIICLVRIAFTPVSGAHAWYELGYFYQQVSCHEYQMIYLMGPRPERVRRLFRSSKSEVWCMPWVRNITMIHNRFNESLPVNFRSQRGLVSIQSEHNANWLISSTLQEMIRCYCNRFSRLSSFPLLVWERLL